LDKSCRYPFIDISKYSVEPHVSIGFYSLFNFFNVDAMLNLVKVVLHHGGYFTVNAQLAATIFSFLKRRKPAVESNETWPYYAKKPLSEPEQILYHRLVAALPQCIVLAQVQLSQVLGVNKGVNFLKWNNRINRMSIDFIVCLKDSSVIAAVELDDKTHEETSRIEADAKKEKALSTAGIALIRWHVSELPDERAIRQAFTN